MLSKFSKALASRLPRRINPWWSELVILEPYQDYSEAIDAHVVPDERQMFFSMTAGHARVFLKQAADKGIDLSHRVVPFKTIDPELDNDLYGTAWSMAQNYFRILRNTSSRMAGDADVIVPKEIVHPLAIALHDRFVTQMRGSWLLLNTIRDRDFARWRLIPRHGHASPYVHRLLNADRARPVVELTSHLPPNHAEAAERRAKARTVKTFRRLPTFDFPSLGPPTGRFDIFMSNFKDRQYGATSAAVLGKLPPDRQLLIMSSSKPELEAAAQYDIAWKSVPGDIQPITTLHPDARAIMDRALALFQDFLAAHEDPRVQMLDSKITAYIATVIPSLLDFGQTFHRAFGSLLDRADTVTVSPGRHIEAGLLVAMANARKPPIPTIEIQSGTISATNRFVPPRATNVLCIDPFSQGVFSRHMGRKLERCHVVGAPKLDEDLAPWRNADPAMVREASAEIATPADRRILLIASQPCSVPVMRQLVELALDGAALAGDVAVVIKTHPNEDENYARAYAEAAALRPSVPFQVLHDTPLHAALLSADVVSTYFSTVGMEAFCLKKPVVALNPYPTRPPFDLQELGVAAEAGTPEELAALLRDPSALAFDDPRLAALQDGLAAERSARFIIARGNAHRRRLGIA